MKEIAHEVVCLREMEDPPFAFWQIAKIISARHPDTPISDDDARALYWHETERRFWEKNSREGKK